MTSFRLRADRQLTLAHGSSERFLLASITAPMATAQKDRMPVNIALVLDRSGSMQGENKFPLSVSAARQALALLGNAEYAERQMSPMALKQWFFVAESSVKGRSLQGKARRG